MGQNEPSWSECQPHDHVIAMLCDRQASDDHENQAYLLPLFSGEIVLLELACILSGECFIPLAEGTAFTNCPVFLSKEDH